MWKRLPCVPSGRVGGRKGSHAASPPPQSGGVAPLHRTLLGTDGAIPAIHQQPFPVARLILHAHAQLPGIALGAAERIAAHGAHAEARRGLRAPRPDQGMNG